MSTSNVITFIAAILILFGLAGFFYHDQIQVAPTYKIKINNESIELMGEEGKFGVEKKSVWDSNFLVAKKSKSYMWYFWAESKDLADKKISIFARKEKTGELLPPFTTSVSLSLKDDAGVIAIPIEMEFPSRGLWHLGVYVDDELWGSVDVKVKDYKRGATRYSPTLIKP